MAEKTRTLPERHGKRWEEDEIQYVLGRIKQGKWPIQIATEVKRTPGGIVSRLKEIAYERVKGGMTLEEASSLTSLTVDQIEEHIKKTDLAEQIREERKTRPAQPKQMPLRPFFLGKPDETILDVVVEIRDLLRQLVNSQTIQVPTTT